MATYQGQIGIGNNVTFSDDPMPGAYDPKTNQPWDTQKDANGNYARWDGVVRKTDSGGLLSDWQQGLSDLAPGLAVGVGAPAAVGGLSSLLAAGGGLGSVPGAAVAGSEYGALPEVAGASGSGGGLGGGLDMSGFMNTGANPSNIFTASPSSLGDLSLNPGAGNIYDLAGANGAASTGISAIDAPGSVVNLSGGGMTLPASFWDNVKSYGPSAMSAVQKFISGGGGGAGGGLADAGGLMALLGKIAPAALGAFGASQQAGQYKDLADKYLAIGAPSRDRYEASFQPGFDLASADPGYKDALAQTTKETLNRLSTGGNPAGSPNAWNQTLTDVNTKLALPALQNYRSMNAGSGGLGALTGAAPAAENAAINANAGVTNAVGAGAANIFNPPQTLADLLKAAKAAGY